VKLKDSLRTSLASIITAASCSATSTWNKCFDTEKKLGRLGKVGSLPKEPDYKSSSTKGPRSPPSDVSPGPNISEAPPSPPQASRGGKNAGAIAAGVLVPALLMAGLCFAISWWRRRKNAISSVLGFDEGLAGPLEEEPSEYPFSRQSTDCVW